MFSDGKSHLVSLTLEHDGTFDISVDQVCHHDPSRPVQQVIADDDRHKSTESFCKSFLKPFFKGKNFAVE